MCLLLVYSEGSGSILNVAALERISGGGVCFFFTLSTLESFILKKLEKSSQEKFYFQDRIMFKSNLHVKLSWKNNLCSNNWQICGFCWLFFADIQVRFPPGPSAALPQRSTVLVGQVIAHSSFSPASPIPAWWTPPNYFTSRQWVDSRFGYLAGQTITVLERLLTVHESPSVVRERTWSREQC